LRGPPDHPGDGRHRPPPTGKRDALLLAAALTAAGGSATAAQQPAADTPAAAGSAGSPVEFPWYEPDLGLADRTNVLAVEQVDRFTTWIAGNLTTGKSWTQMLLDQDLRQGTQWRQAKLPTIPGSRLNDLDVAAPDAAAWVGDHVPALGGVASAVWDGTNWNTTPVPVPATAVGGGLLAVDMITADDAWAVGWAQVPTGGTTTDPEGGEHPETTFQGLLGHWDGQAWTEVPLPSFGRWWDLSTVSATGPDDVWAAGHSDGSPLFLHYDGTAWTRVPNPSPAGGLVTSIEARGPGDVWAVGFRNIDRRRFGIAFHFDGTAWRELALPEGVPLLTDVTGSGDGVVVVGHDGWTTSVALRWEAGRWTRLQLPTPDGRPLFAQTIAKLGHRLVIGGAREDTGTEPMQAGIFAAFDPR
jgi:hypothetical protein